MMMTYLSNSLIGISIGIIGFCIGSLTKQKPIDFKPAINVSPTPINVETKECGPSFDYAIMKRELQRVIDRNEARVLPKFGRR